MILPTLGMPKFPHWVAWLAFLLCGFVSGLMAQQHARIIGRPDAAVKLAATDVQQLLATDPEQAAHVWYVWIRDSEDREFIDGYDYVLNTGTSRARFPLRTAQIAGGAAGTLLRLDLREWLPDRVAMSNFLQLIEQYADPHFYVEGEVTEKILPASGTTSTGQKIDKLTFRFPEISFSPAILAMAGEEATILQEVTGLTVPIVEAERWLVISLRTLQGGLYYKLQGYDAIVGNERKRLNQTEWLALFGASELESERLGGEEYVGMWRSNVTGKPRRAKFIYGTGTRPSVGLPLVVITQDGDDEQLNTDEHPIYSLFDFEFAATEILAVRPNGAIAYGLFAANGDLQDSAPDNVVKDHEIPRPHTARLESAIACIRCHGDQNQWKPMPNQVKSLLSLNSGGTKLEVLADFSNGKSAEEVSNQLQALYSGDLTLPLQLARDATEFATIRMVGWKLPADGYAKAAAQMVAERFSHYVYDAVDPVEALRSLGIVVNAEVANETFLNLFPLVGGRLIDPAIATLQRHKEDPDLVVNRSDWERIYPAALGEAIAYGEVKIEQPKLENDNAQANDPDAADPS